MIYKTIAAVDCSDVCISHFDRAAAPGFAGAVLKWCPKDNPMRSLLGTLKSTVKATPLQVYPVHVTQDGSIWTKLVL